MHKYSPQKCYPLASVSITSEYFGHFVKRNHATAKENELTPDGPTGSVAYMRTVPTYLILVFTMIILKQLDERVLLRVVLPDLMPERGWGVRTGFLRCRGQALSTYIIQ